MGLFFKKENKRQGDGKWVKTPAAKPVNLSSIPRDQTQSNLDEKRLLLQFHIMVHHHARKDKK